MNKAKTISRCLFFFKNFTTCFLLRVEFIPFGIVFLSDDIPIHIIGIISGNTFGNVFFIDHNIDHRVISRCIKGNILKKILNYCVQTPRTDILTGFVCVESRFRNGAESLLFELDSDIIRFKQCGILFCYCVLRSGQYSARNHPL